MQVATAGLTKTLRLLPGAYTEPLALQSTSVVKAVGVGAVLGTNNSNLVVKNGATLELRGITIQASGSTKAVDLETAAGLPRSVLTLRDAVLTATNTAFCTNVTVHLERVEHRGNWLVGDGTIFEADRVQLENSLITQSGSGTASVRITNSTFLNSYVTTRRDLGVAFSTFVFTDSSQFQACDNLASASTSYFENNVFFATPSTGLPFVATAGMCHWSNNIMFPQSNAIAGNSIVDPMLVDVATGDFHLQQLSPAINAGNPSASFGTGHDFDGVMRPQGAAHDIGAFERLP